MYRASTMFKALCPGTEYSLVKFKKEKKREKNRYNACFLRVFILAGEN